MNVNINKVIVAGRVCQLPQLKSTNNGMNFCHFTLAISRRIRSAEGQSREEVDFVDITAFGKTADNCVHYLQKGTAVFVEAKLRQETWKDKNTNQNRHRLTLIADRVHFLEPTPQQRTGRQGINEPAIVPSCYLPMDNAPRLPPRHAPTGIPAPQPMMPQDIYDDPAF